MIEPAAKRAKLLRAAARAACKDLTRRDAKALHALLPKVGATGTGYDEWGTTMKARQTAKLFATPADLSAALSSLTLEATAIALVLEARVDAKKTYARVKDALPLDDTHFAPNFLEAYIQKALVPVMPFLQAAMPAKDIEAAFIAGKIALDDAIAAKVPAAAIAKADLGYVHRDEVEKFLKRHPIGKDLNALTTLLAEIGPQETHAANAFRAVLFERLAKHPPAADVAVKLHAANIFGAFHMLLALRHRPTLEAELARLSKVKFTPKFDRHHTKPELRPAIDAGFALDPKTATERFALYFTAKAVASERGAVIAHDILVGGSLRNELTDPRWPQLLAPLAKDKRLGPVVKPYL